MSLAAKQRINEEKRKEAFRLIKTYPGEFDVKKLAQRLHVHASLSSKWFKEYEKELKSESS